MPNYWRGRQRESSVIHHHLDRVVFVLLDSTKIIMISKLIRYCNHTCDCETFNVEVCKKWEKTAYYYYLSVELDIEFAWFYARQCFVLVSKIKKAN